MNFAEKLKKILDEQRLDKEIKEARKKIADKEKEKVQVVKINNEKNFDNNENSEQTNVNQDKETKKYKFSIERLKDAGLVAVAVMLIGIGYANFSGSENNDIQNQVIQTASESENNLGDVQLVNSEATSLVENDNTVNNSNTQASNSNSTEIENTVNNLSCKQAAGQKYGDSGYKHSDCLVGRLELSGHGLQRACKENHHGRNTRHCEQYVFRYIEQGNLRYGNDGPVQDENICEKIDFLVESHQHAEHVKGNGARQDRHGDSREDKTPGYGNEGVCKRKHKHDQAPVRGFSGS